MITFLPYLNTQQGWYIYMNECFILYGRLVGTLPETNSSPLEMDGWNTILSYWVSAYFEGRLLLVPGRVNIHNFMGI